MTTLTSSYYLNLAANKGDVIKVGSNDRNAIKSIQEALSTAGYELEIDGLFGPKTKRAIKEFQREMGLDATGQVGEKTLDKLSKVKPEDVDASTSTDPSISSAKSSVPSGTVHKPKPSTSSSSSGSSKSDKGGPQTTKVNGVETRVDPVTGKPIATSATGPIGSTEQGAYGATSPQFEDAHPRAGAGQSTGGQFVSKGDSGQNVQNVQKQLNQQDYNLKVDGQFGPKTEQAVKNFQSSAQNANGKPLAVDGVVGFQTAGALKRAANKENT